jgi:hypothetical protein
MGVVAEGIFNATHETIEIISAPATTRDLLIAFQSILERAKSGAISSEEAVEQSRETLGGAAASLAKAALTNLALLALLLSMLQIAIDFWENRCDDEFQAKMLESQSQIISLLEKQSERKPADKAKKKRADPTEKESLPPRVMSETTKDRRSAVNSKRRADLKTHRIGFGGSGTVHKFKGKPET